MWKTSKHCFEGVRDNSHQNPILLKLKLDCQSNKTTNSTTSEAELLYGEVDEAELSLVK
jgi:hypothetical protein